MQWLSTAMIVAEGHYKLTKVIADIFLLLPQQ
jgi:hypothetical protein